MYNFFKGVQEEILTVGKYLCATFRHKCFRPSCEQTVRILKNNQKEKEIYQFVLKFAVQRYDGVSYMMRGGQRENI